MWWTIVGGDLGAGDSNVSCNDVIKCHNDVIPAGDSIALHARSRQAPEWTVISKLLSPFYGRGVTNGRQRRVVEAPVAAYRCPGVFRQMDINSGIFKAICHLWEKSRSKSNRIKDLPQKRIDRSLKISQHHSLP